jgi:hypothetical protein
MRFFFSNGLGDSGYFTETNIVKAIHAAWNIEADLYLMKKDTKRMIFAPLEDNEFNSDLLEEYGYKMEDGKLEREIIDMYTGEVIKYNLSEIKQLF